MRGIVEKILILLLCVCLLSGCTAGTAQDTGTVTDAVTDAVTDGNTGNDTDSGAESDEVVWELDESKKEEIYQRAIEAKEKKEYQFSHALFSVLSREGYKDSKNQEKELISRAYAVPAITTYFNCVNGGNNCSLSEDKIKELSYLPGKGVLYIGEGGTPHFAFADNNGNIIDMIPDTTLHGVVSLIDWMGALHSSLDAILCLKDDGTVGAIHSLRSDESNPLIDNMVTQKDVVQIVPEDETDTVFYLRKDGTVSVYLDPVADDPLDEREVYRKEMAARVELWKDIVCVREDGFYVIGLKSDGTLVTDVLFIGDVDEPDHYAELKEQIVQTMNPYNEIFCNFIVKGSTAYHDPAYEYFYKYPTYPEVVLKDENTKAVHNSYERLIDVDGNIFLTTTGEKIGTVDGIAYICDGFVVWTDGKITVFSDDLSEYEKVFSAIKVNVS